MLKYSSSSLFVRVTLAIIATSLVATACYVHFIQSPQACDIAILHGDIRSKAGSVIERKSKETGWSVHAICELEVGKITSSDYLMRICEYYMKYSSVDGLDAAIAYHVEQCAIFRLEELGAADKLVELAAHPQEHYDNEMAFNLHESLIRLRKSTLPLLLERRGQSYIIDQALKSILNKD